MRSLKCVRERVTVGLGKFSKQNRDELHHSEEKMLEILAAQGLNVAPELQKTNKDLFSLLAA